jgi:Flp pilus assembly protein TadD
MFSIVRPVLAPIVVVVAFSGFPIGAAAQTARISEDTRVINTYPFSEPNAIPILTRDPRLYPYHSFEGYAREGVPREWTVIHLENDHIEVFVLPEAGGKVWGAVVKETGHEFIYRNEVMKFRNIALRGPWTSGGIEFNFGVIGHTPSTATPVDYMLRENPDGSVSAFVGAMDLPSRTHWRVEIRLPADRAYFETNVLWYNPTPLQQPYYNWMTAAAFAREDLEVSQPYYNWMTAAAFAREDLEVSIPGNAYLEHSGAERSWPFDDAGRYLPLYRNNTFAGHKSFHVVGELNDFFGGYYADEDYGFGHWSRYEEMPGQKLWLWALSRQGGVWEELLTDTDGQYVEFQAGRLLVQYAPGASVNPITQAGFDPVSASRWTETWFPVEGIGGLTDASRDGAMYVKAADGQLTIGVNAFGDLTDTLTVSSGGRVILSQPVAFSALEAFEAVVDLSPGDDFRIELPTLGLDYSSDPRERLLSRPFTTDPAAWPQVPEVDRRVFEGRELVKARRYSAARSLFQAAVAEVPWNREALLGLADLSYRSATYQAGLEHVNKVLQLDAYDAEANFIAGNLYRGLERPADARDAFGWAARSTAYRSAAYTQFAELMIRDGQLGEASRYARLAIDHDRYNVPAWQVMAIAGRKAGGEAGRAQSELAAQRLLEIDPLHHFTSAEAYLAAPTPESARMMTSALRSEYPDQTMLELAIDYANRGLPDDAAVLLQLDTTRNPLIRAWRAWLEDDPALLTDGGDPAFVFPYRRETIPVLEWARRQSDDWVWTYLFALNLWAKDREDEAAPLLAGLGDTPDFAAFYVARGYLLERTLERDPSADLRRAVALAPEDRTILIRLIRHEQEQGRWTDALALSEQGRRSFPEDFNLDLLHARGLINLGRGREATELLAVTHVLPSENARQSHRLYERAHTLVALDAIEAERYAEAKRHLAAALEWPERFGQGRPYDPEERLVRYLLGWVEQKLGNPDQARREFLAVVDATGSLHTDVGRQGIPMIPSLYALGRTAELQAIAADAAADTDAGRFAAALARALADGPDDSGAVGRRLAAEYPELFSDLDGRLLRRALSY